MRGVYVLPCAPPAFEPAPAPCDDCRFRERCGRELLACDSFAIYLHGYARTLASAGVLPTVSS